MLSDYSKYIKNKLDIGNSKVEKLVLNLYDKEIKLFSLEI